MDTHVIREGHDPKRGRYWGAIEPGGDYDWLDAFHRAETFTAEQAAELVPDLEHDGVTCRAVAIADISDEDVAP